MATLEREARRASCAARELAKADYGSGWYHDAAVEEAEQTCASLQDPSAASPIASDRSAI